jgi:hypothetical protein
MSKGFYSRSPEEFRKYLEGINGNTKTKNWRNAIIFLDILLLMLVLYMAAKAMNPGLDIAMKPSERIIINNTEVFFARSETQSTDQISYFLFTKNLDKVEKKFGAYTANLQFISETGLICHRVDFKLDEKKLISGGREFYNLSFTRIKKDELPSECKNLYRTPAFPRSVYNLSFGKKYKVDALLEITTDSDKKQIRLTETSW